MSASLGMGPDLHTFLKIKALTIFEVYVIDIYFDRKDSVNVKEYLQARKECARRVGRSEGHLNNRIFVISDTKRHPK